MSNEKKSAVITFKAEGKMLEALNNIPNRSEFIRAALLNALSETCPLCGGAGFLNVKQRQHWEDFTRQHTVRHCRKCDALTFECRESTQNKMENRKCKEHSHHHKEKECCQ
jgi:hypothetical protein